MKEKYVKSQNYLNILTDLKTPKGSTKNILVENRPDVNYLSKMKVQLFVNVKWQE